ncbi:MAG: hypothetical protein ABSH42_16410 [Bryobacteraceae bacterium]|jgi:hypothetical protein
MSLSTLILCFCLCALAAAASAETPLETGYRQMYDLQFAGAHRTFADWQSTHPDDPMGPASDAAAYLFTEFDRLHILQSEFFTHDQHFFTDHKLAPDPIVKRKFDAELDTAHRLAARCPQSADCQFAAILANGLHSDYMALIETRYAASFQEMKASRSMAERLLAAHPEMYDAWIAIGVENYMLSIKPLPVRWLLRLAGGETDKAVGIEKLQLTAEKGHYLAPFAKLLLAVAALRDHNTWRARTLLEGLVREYPHNPLYAEELARLLPAVSTGAGGMGAALR